MACRRMCASSFSIIIVMIHLRQSSALNVQYNSNLKFFFFIIL